MTTNTSGPVQLRSAADPRCRGHRGPVVYCADTVLSRFYRQPPHHPAGPPRAAEQGPKEELFDYMVQLGTAQRAAWNRLNNLPGRTDAHLSTNRGLQRSHEFQRRTSSVEVYESHGVR